jgi:hypothetical protein
MVEPFYSPEQKLFIRSVQFLPKRPRWGLVFGFVCNVVFWGVAGAMLWNLGG